MSSDDVDAPPHETDVCFIVTGFGPFRDVPSNPTTAIVHHLVDYLRHREAEASNASGDASRGCIRLSTVTHTRIIETSAREARKVVEELYDELTGSFSGFNSTPQHRPTTTIFLHLGVNYKGTAFQIEACAYNEADFRVPDERGEQPQGATIIDGRELGAELYTGFDVPGLVSTMDDSPLRSTWLLKSPGTGDEEGKRIVCESRDPGRFVCNFTYCLSLDRCQTHNLREKNDKVWSIFLHVPPFDQIPEQVQLEFIARLMEKLLIQSSGK